MNFNPQNEQGLMGLLAALKSGMDPNTAYGVYGDIMNSQATAVANRQQRLGGLSQLLMGAAQEGLPYQGAEALMQAAPGPAGPAAQNILESLYPNGGPQTPAPPMNAAGQPIQAPPGYYDHGQQSMSPAYQPPQPSVSEQLAMQQMQMDQQAAQAEQTQAAAWAQVQQQLTAAKAKGYTPDQAVAALSSHPEYASLFASDPGTLQKMMQNLFGSAAVSMAGAPGLGG